MHVDSCFVLHCIQVVSLIISMAEATNSEIDMSEVEEEESMMQDSPWTWSPDGSSAEGAADSGEDELSDEMFVRVKPEHHAGYEYIFVAKEWNPKQSDIYKLPSMDGWKHLHWVSWLKIDEGIPNIFINCSGLNGAANKPLDCICVEMLCLRHHVPHECELVN